MSIPRAKLWRQPSAPSPVVLPDELITDILSMLPVKPLMRLRCMSKSWNSQISHPSFVSMHLRKSKRNPHLTLMWEHNSASFWKDRSVVPFPVSRLLENPSTNVPDNPCYHFNEKDFHLVVGSCNGLLCLVGHSYERSFSTLYQEHSLCFWNPATRTRCRLGSFRVCPSHLSTPLKFAFGYDNLTDTFKVVAFRVIRDVDDSSMWRSRVIVFSLGDHMWRSIQGFPAIPINCTYPGQNNGVHLSGTINWLALRDTFTRDHYRDWKDITVEQFVIVSLDLSTETYTELLLPAGFDDRPLLDPPTVGVLLDRLCFSYDFKGTHFVIWQMKEVGVQESWTQFLRISYQSLQPNPQMDNGDDDGDGNDDWAYEFRLLPLCVYGDTLILADDDRGNAILYNWRDNRVAQTNITRQLQWTLAKDYVESLVSSF